MKIALIGAPGAGKDVVADFLVSKKGFKKLAFADQIKQEYYAATGYSEEQFKNARGTELEHTIRDGLWKYSSKIKKEYGNQYFIDPIIEKLAMTSYNVVVSDARTLDEVKELRKQRTIFVWVIRNYREDFKDLFIPGTRILVRDAVEYLKFWNDYRNLNETYSGLELFFKELEEEYINGPR